MTAHAPHAHAHTHVHVDAGAPLFERALATALAGLYNAAPAYDDPVRPEPCSDFTLALVDGVPRLVRFGFL